MMFRSCRWKLVLHFVYCTLLVNRWENLESCQKNILQLILFSLLPTWLLDNVVIMKRETTVAHDFQVYILSNCHKKIARHIEAQDHTISTVVIVIIKVLEAKSSFSPFIFRLFPHLLLPLPLQILSTSRPHLCYHPLVKERECPSNCSQANVN